MQTGAQRVDAETGGCQLTVGLFLTRPQAVPTGGFALSNALIGSWLVWRLLRDEPARKKVN